MKKNILYISENKLYYYSYKYNKIFECLIRSDVINESKISKPKIFFGIFNNFLKKNKLLTSIFTEKIDVIIEENFKDSDKNILDEILLKLNFKNIRYISTKSILKIKKNILYINNNKDYSVIYYKDKFDKEKTFVINKKIFVNSSFEDYINKNYRNYKTIYNFGEKELEELKDFDLYIYQNSPYFIIENYYNLQMTK